MAEETQSGSDSGGGNSSGMAGQFKAILTKKVGPVPYWAIGVVLILIVAFIMKRRAASKAQAANADTSGTGSSAVGNVSSQTFPYGQPMNFSSDVFINQPQTPPVTSTTPTTPTTTPVAPTPPKTVTVLPGWHVNQWINDLNKQGIAVTYDELVAANPQLVQNISWNGGPGPGYPSGTTAANTFKTGATYNLPYATSNV